MSTICVETNETLKWLQNAVMEDVRFYAIQWILASEGMGG